MWGYLSKTRSTACRKGGFFASNTGYGRWQVVEKLTGVSSEAVPPESNEEQFKKQLLMGYIEKKLNENPTAHDSSGAGQKRQNSSNRL